MKDISEARGRLADLAGRMRKARCGAWATEIDRVLALLPTPRPGRRARAAAAILAGLACALSGHPAAAQTERFHGADGRPLGRAEHRGATTRFYGHDGRSTGRAERDGAVTRFYDEHGRSRGRVVEDNKSNRRAYDAHGRAAGTARTDGARRHGR